MRVFAVYIQSGLFGLLRLLVTRARDETKRTVLLAFTTGPPFFVELFCKTLLRMTRSHDRSMNIKRVCRDLLFSTAETITLLRTLLGTRLFFLWSFNDQRIKRENFTSLTFKLVASRQNILSAVIPRYFWRQYKIPRRIIEFIHRGRWSYVLYYAMHCENWSTCARCKILCARWKAVHCLLDIPPRPWKVQKYEGRDVTGFHTGWEDNGRILSAVAVNRISRNSRNRVKVKFPADKRRFASRSSKRRLILRKLCAYRTEPVAAAIVSPACWHCNID